MLIIGSHALNAHNSGHRPTPMDVDIIAKPEDAYDFANALKRAGGLKQAYPMKNGDKYIVMDTSKMIYEFEMAWPDSTGEELLEIAKPVGEIEFTNVFGQRLVTSVPSIDVLYALKLSHRYLKNSPHFRKTFRDIQVLRILGANLNDPVLNSWFKRREKETYNYPHPKLNVMKDDFFRGDGVEYFYDHDSIHVAMAHLLSGPAYKLFQTPGAEVHCSKDLFLSLDEESRLYSVLEEVQVLALERSQIPFHYQPAPRWSFDKAHEKVCTSITSGWWREFAWENWDVVQSMYEPDYVERFKRAVDKGVATPIKKKEQYAKDQGIRQELEASAA